MKPTEMKGGQATQDPTLQGFAIALEERITRSRGLLFENPTWIERRDNEKARQREQKGDREFDYPKSIPILVGRISSMDPSRRESATRTLVNGVSYRLSGIHVNVPGYSTQNAPLLADVAQDPQKYFNHN